MLASFRAQRKSERLGDLKPHEIFVFSLTGSEAKNKVIEANINVKEVLFDFSSMDSRNVYRDSSVDVCVEFQPQIKSELCHAVWTTNPPYGVFSLDKEKLNIEGHQTECRITTDNNGEWTFWIEEVNPVRFLNALNAHIRHIYSFRREVSLKTHVSKMLSVPMTGNIRKTEIIGNVVEPQRVVQYLKHFPDVEFLKLECRFDGVFEVPNIMLRTESLMIIQPAQTHMMRIFHSFEGRHLYYDGSRTPIALMNNLLLAWKAGKMRNLSSMIMKVNVQVEYTPWRLLQDLDAYHYNEEHRPPQFPYDSIIQEHLDLPEDFTDCSIAYDFRRTRDNTIATISFAGEYMMFFVWNDNFYLGIF
ncbi:hypothetical protein GCK72_023318 [Caenorhabditis remanei]|uniref:F-box associated domain-containing protein n=1 Tax=Caenorhabditis remanei TaxID=31234 RepID=A0A6A5FW08_CAERE|nr:hypothetical protein GCK72_023318 [Caenorhabditis remanei]KAF1746860.1 hypothetical protein GCK72_023318 [Caenorhabditis remanei]